MRWRDRAHFCAVHAQGMRPHTGEHALDRRSGEAHMLSLDDAAALADGGLLISF